MLRVLGLGLAVAAVLVSVGPIEQGRLTEARWDAALDGSIDDQEVVRRLDDVLDISWGPCEVLRPDCPDDLHTATGTEWIHGERRLRAEVDGIANSVDSLKAPLDKAREQADLVRALRRCSKRLRRLEADVPVVYNLDVIGVFEKYAYGALSRCFFYDLSQIAPQFSPRNYRLSWHY